MTQAEKQLLPKDLCVRLPYGVQGISSEGEVSPLLTRGEADWDILTSLNYRIIKHGWKPYLRPMESMTEEEKLEFKAIGVDDISKNFIDFGEFLCESSPVGINVFINAINLLNKKCFDYRGLIEKGLAIEAPEPVEYKKE